jgi:hypothetical protein
VSVILFVILLWLLVKSSHAVLPLLETDKTPAGIAARLIVTSAGVVCLMGFGITLLPGASAALIILGLLAGCALWLVSLRHKQHSPQLDQSNNPVNILFILAALVFVLRLWPAIETADLAPLQGTGNHDDLYYTFGADVLRWESLLSLSPQSTPWLIDDAVAMYTEKLPRIGSELSTVFIATCFNLPTEFAFTITLALSSSMLFLAVMLLFVVVAAPQTLSLFWGGIIIAISPTMLYTYGNVNMATLFGLTFLTAYYSYWILSLETHTHKSSPVAAGVCLAAMIVCYPELLIVAVPATGIASAVSVLNKRVTLTVVMQNCLIVCVTIFLFSPYYIYAMGATAKSIANAVAGPPSVYVDFFRESPPTVVALKMLLGNIEWLPRRASTFVSALVLICIFVVIRYAQTRAINAVLPLMLPSIVVGLWFAYIDYGYGGVKILQFLSVPASVLLASGFCCLGKLSTKQTSV